MIEDRPCQFDIVAKLMRTTAEFKRTIIVMPTGAGARTAIMALKKTFDSWVTLGPAQQRARKIADGSGGQQTLQRLLEQQGLASIVGQKATWRRATANHGDIAGTHRMA
jgi:hypothetical protein